MASTFHLTISGDLDDFINFCALIHAGLQDEATAKLLIARLKAATDKLADAEAAVPPPAPPVNPQP